VGWHSGGTATLRNPVYSDDGHHILVWIAKLADNKGVYSRDGQAISPHILSPDFDTDYIQCTQLPYTVRDTEASYFLKGAYREGDNLEVVELGLSLMPTHSIRARRDSKSRDLRPENTLTREQRGPRWEVAEIVLESVFLLREKQFVALTARFTALPPVN
jgi:hypothetical protein